MTENQQAKVWNETVGEAWVEHADQFDTTLEPFGNAALGLLGVKFGDRVVDIGCGTGATTRAIALLSDPGQVTGVDVSTTMLAAARHRSAVLANVTYVECDVETTPLGSRLFDVAFSRFGVMFFSDPTRAFTNVFESLVSRGRLGFVCFQAPPLNPFIVVPIMAAAPHLSMGPPAGPNDPSPFSLADPSRIGSILAMAGFVDVDIVPGPTEAILANDSDLTTVARRLLEQNPGTATGFSTATAANRDAAISAAADALAPHQIGGRLALPAATWLVTATADK